MPLADEISKMIPSINKGLTQTYGATRFTEDPAEGELSVITVAKRWVPITNDKTQVQGDLWILRGCNSFCDAQGWGLVLSSQITDAEKAVRAILNTEIKQYAKPFFSVIKDAQEQFTGWDIGIKIRLEGAHQQAPYLVQIRTSLKLQIPGVKNGC